MRPEEILHELDVAPETALILGSGLGGLADAVEDPQIIPTADIEGYPKSSVEGHKGRVVVGRLENASVLMIQGRAHLYEGHDIDAVTFPVRLAHSLGARRLLVTNAAGGIHPNLSPGTLMIIAGHLNFAGAKPGLAGQVRSPHVRPQATFYDEEWMECTERAAISLGIRTMRGVYLWTRGPSYETPAEIAAFRRLGADAVGMSTVPEVLQAGALGMPVLGLSSITNRAAGLSEEPLSHDDVLRVGRRVASDLERLIRRVVRDETGGSLAASRSPR